MLMFPSFNAWRSHEMDHRREWICPVCSRTSHDKLKASMHLSQHHGDMTKHYGLEMLLQTSSHAPEYLPASDCPFCDWSTTLRKRNSASEEQSLTIPSKRFMKHLGRHLEEIALFVVPQPEDDQHDPEDVGSNVVHASQDGNSDIASTLTSFKSRAPSVASVSLENGHTQREPCEEEDLVQLPEDSDEDTDQR